MKYYNELNKKIIETPKFDIDILNRSGRKLYSFVNPFSYEVISNNKELIDGVDGWYVDGMLLCKLIKYKYNVMIERTSFDFSSIANDVFETANDNCLKIALIGATSAEVERAVEALERKYNALDIVITSDGYLDEIKEKSIISEIIKLKPSLIILGMGTPYQEVFGLKIKKRADYNCAIYTCGGFITQTSIRDDYYYPIVKKLNLRSLQRFIFHSHVRQRVINKYPKFIYNYLMAKNND